jgi:hypothetical protein
MRKLAITLAATSTLCLAAAGWAALPSKGPFAGKTSLNPINGFADLVTFSTAANGRSLKKFQFGTLGCFGHGSYPVGTDPYGDPTAIGTINSVVVSPKGAILLTTKPLFPQAGLTVTTATLKGTFTSVSALNGTITISQSDNGSTCGPMTMKFSASSGTPASLGLNGG